MEKQTLTERLKLYAREERRSEKPANRLLLATSAAATAGAMLIPPPAEAAIVYSGMQNKVVNSAQPQQQVDFNEDGNVEFTFNLSASVSYFTQKLAVTGTASVIKNNYGPARLASNYSVSSKKTFFSVNSDDLAYGASSAATGGNFLDAQGYLGVTFKIDANTHYGWIQYQANSDASVGTIIDWAYEDTPDKAIKTGATKSFNWNLFLPAIIAAKNK